MVGLVTLTGLGLGLTTRVGAGEGFGAMCLVPVDVLGPPWVERRRTCCCGTTTGWILLTMCNLAGVQRGRGQGGYAKEGELQGQAQEPLCQGLAQICVF